MDKPDCGSCDHQGRVEQKRVECRVDGEWHERGYTCEDFKDYIRGKTNEERLAEALEIKRGREAKAAEQREREFAEQMAQKDREHAEELARLGREHDAEMSQVRMAYDKKLWRASWWWQIVLIVVGAVIREVVGRIF